MDSLAVAIPVFLASAVLVVLAGVALARFGDQVADITGWGTLWVGTILVSIATSLPELMTNITAVLIDSPGLALGNVFGADMINIFTISLVAMVFGIRNLFGNQLKDTQTLVIVAVVLGIIAFVFGALRDWALGPTSVGALVIAGGVRGGDETRLQRGERGARCGSGSGRRGCGGECGERLPRVARVLRRGGGGADSGVLPGAERGRHRRGDRTGAQLHRRAARLHRHDAAGGVGHGGRRRCGGRTGW